MRVTSAFAVGFGVLIASQSLVAFSDDCAVPSRWSRLWNRNCDETCCVCKECCCRKKCSCFSPAEPPRAEVAFVVPAVVRRGQAVQISETAMRRGIQSEAARELAAEAARSKGRETGAIDGDDCHARIDKLQRDVQRLSDVVERLNTNVEALTNGVPPGPRIRN